MLWQGECLKVPRPLNPDVEKSLRCRVAQFDLYLCSLHQPHHRVEAGGEVVEVVVVVNRWPRAQRRRGGSVLENSGVSGDRLGADSR